MLGRPVLWACDSCQWCCLGVAGEAPVSLHRLPAPQLHWKQCPVAETTATMARTRRLSGLQKQVLALYRQCLRAARQQPTPEARAASHAYVTAEFRKQVRTRS